jgi:hypothetical protein
MEGWPAFNGDGSLASSYAAEDARDRPPFASDRPPFARRWLYQQGCPRLTAWMFDAVVKRSMCRVQLRGIKSIREGDTDPLSEASVMRNRPACSKEVESFDQTGGRRHE